MYIYIYMYTSIYVYIYSYIDIQEQFIYIYILKLLLYIQYIYIYTSITLLWSPVQLISRWVDMDMGGTVLSLEIGIISPFEGTSLWINWVFHHTKRATSAAVHPETAQNCWQRVYARWMLANDIQDGKMMQNGGRST